MKVLSANHYWRIIAAGLSYVSFGIGAFLPGLYILFLGITPLKPHEKQKRVRRAIQLLCYFYIHLMQFLGLMKYEVSGKGYIPNGSHLIISNHSMLIDALFVMAYVPNLCCIVKGSLCNNVITRLPIKLAGFISNNDENLVELAVSKITAGENVLIFPEGTRNEYDTQLEFRRGAANIAVIANAPILPAVICCQPRALQRNQAWYELPEIKSKITLKFLATLSVENCIDTSTSRPLQYRRLTDWLREFYVKEVTEVISQPSTAI